MTPDLQLQFMILGGGTLRYHTRRTIQEDSIASHSWGVAWLCGLLTRGRPSAALIMAALAHDMAEQDLGDTPSPAKRALGVNAQVNDIEMAMLNSQGVGHYFDELTDTEKRILKYADILEGMLFCVRERQLGNSGLSGVYWRFHSYITQMNPARDCAAAVDLLQAVERAWARVSAGAPLRAPNSPTFLEMALNPVATAPKDPPVIVSDLDDDEWDAQQDIIESRRLEARADGLL